MPQCHTSSLVSFGTAVVQPYCVWAAFLFDPVCRESIRVDTAVVGGYTRALLAIVEEPWPAAGILLLGTLLQ